MCYNGCNQYQYNYGNYGACQIYPVPFMPVDPQYANAYVPYQTFTVSYPASEGLEKGLYFLNYTRLTPIVGIVGRGKVMGDRNELLTKIQGVEFAALELQLYSDTHPYDQRALMEYNSYSTQLLMLKQQYEMLYGPLLNYGFSPNHGSWRWLESPWPWEPQY